MAIDTVVPYALALMLVVEGILPFVAPQVWRGTFRRVLELKDGQLRFIGLVSMLSGIALLAILA